MNFFISTTGTLIVCSPESFKDWEIEVASSTERGALKYHLFCGPKRDTSSQALRKHEVVITTYRVVGSDWAKAKVLFGCNWTRIILDDGHEILNFRTKQSKAVVSMTSWFRWIILGTRTEKNGAGLHSIFKFLKCQPFDNHANWKKDLPVAALHEQ